MPVSPQDFDLWARATGNPYPKNPSERAALTPEVFSFVRNLAKTGQNQLFGADSQGIVHDEPKSVRYFAENSLLQSPTTPDNNIPKTAGTLDGSLTSQHYQQSHPVVEQERHQRNDMFSTAAKVALGAGLVAGGIAAARTPTGQRLIQEAGTQLQDVGTRVGSFLGQFGAPRSPDVDVVRATGDVTPPTEGEVFKQRDIPTSVKIEQSLTGTPNDPLKTDPWTGRSLTGNRPIDEQVDTFLQSVKQAPGHTPDPWSEDVPAVTPQVGERSIMRQQPILTAPLQKKLQTETATSMRPGRTTVLPRGTTTEGEAGPSALTSGGLSKYAEYGLSAPDVYAIPPDISERVQSFLTTQPQLGTTQKQALNIWQTTGDPNVLAAAMSETPAMPIQVQLPGGETVPTKELFTPFGERVQLGTGVPVTEAREADLITALSEKGLRQKTRERAIAKIAELTGEVPTYPSQEQLQQLPAGQKRALALGAKDVSQAEARLEAAKDFATLYRLSPEAERGTYLAPEISTNPMTGQQTLVGMKPAAEQQAIPTGSFYRMKAEGGTGRQEVGGVGRRREAIEAFPGEVTFGITSGSELESTPFLYQGTDAATGQQVLYRPEDVSPVQVASGLVKPVRGGAVEPQRVMGQEGRTYKGVSADVIDPRSFDPAEAAALAQQYPERVTPEGLLYSEQAMGGMTAARQRTMGQIQRAKGGRGVAVSEAGVDPALGTRFARRPAAPAGSARAEKLAQLKLRADMVRQIMQGQ